MAVALIVGLVRPSSTAPVGAGAVRSPPLSKVGNSTLGSLLYAVRHARRRSAHGAFVPLPDKEPPSL
jgi:hypothetical protein